MCAQNKIKIGKKRHSATCFAHT